MNTSKLICGIAVLTLLADVALAEPIHSTSTAVRLMTQTSPTDTASTLPTKHHPRVLVDAQMDRVTAGVDVVDAGKLAVSAVIAVWDFLSSKSSSNNNNGYNAVVYNTVSAACGCGGRP